MKYVQACIDKGDLGSWRVRIGEELRRHCRLCYEVLETGVHLAFGCAGGEQLGRVWSPWEEMDEKHRWVRSTPLRVGCQWWWAWCRSTSGLSIGRWELGRNAY